MSTTVLASTAKPLELGIGPTRVALNGTRKLADAVASNRRVHLVVRGLRVERQPGVLYHLYLDLPPDAKPAKNDPRHVGAINFYNASRAATEKTAPDRIFYTFDVTDILRSLKTQRIPTVTLIPSRTPKSRPIIFRIELVQSL